MVSIDVTPRPTFIPARVTSLLEATAGRWPRCLPMQHPAAARPRPASTKPDPPGARTHRICDPAYLYGRARVDLKASEILLVHLCVPRILSTALTSTVTFPAVQPSSRPAVQPSSRPAAQPSRRDDHRS